jgi:hypothetical protein
VSLAWINTVQDSFMNIFFYTVLLCEVGIEMAIC